MGGGYLAVKSASPAKLLAATVLKMFPSPTLMSKKKIEVDEK